MHVTHFSSDEDAVPIFLWESFALWSLSFIHSSDFFCVKFYKKNGSTRFYKQLDTENADNYTNTNNIPIAHGGSSDAMVQKEQPFLIQNSTAQM